MRLMCKIIALAGMGVLAASQASANLIVNGGFEDDGTGQFPPNGSAGEPWVSTGLPSEAVVSPIAYEGSKSAQITALGGIAQEVSVVSGQQYLLSFYAKDVGDVYVLGINLGDTTRMSAHFGDISLAPLDLSLIIPLEPGLINPTTTWTLYEFLFTSSFTGDQTVAIGSAAGKLWVDNVSLAAVPEPTTLVAGALLLLPFGLSAVRRFRK